MSKRQFVDCNVINQDLALILVKRAKFLRGPRACLLYDQTDSCIIRIDQPIHFLKEMESLKHVLDLSTFPKDVYLYSDADNDADDDVNGRLGHIKFVSFFRYDISRIRFLKKAIVACTKINYLASYVSFQKE